MSKKVFKGSKSLLVVEQVAAEREIAEIQLERLKNIARERLLSYEECKLYDIFTKNLYLAKGEATTIMATSRTVESIPESDVSDLLEIATTVTETDIKKVLNFVENDKDVETKTPNNKE